MNERQKGLVRGLALNANRASRLTRIWEAAVGSVRAGHARRIAERAHRGSLEATGKPLISHVRRVAKAAPSFARSVAWLHEVLEKSSVSEEELLASGLTDEELRALRLLTRFSDSRSEADYLAHVGHIVRASGPAGEMARAVKRVDLADRKQHPSLRADGWHPPYRAGLALLENDGLKPAFSSRSSPRSGLATRAGELPASP
jgi:hypothetical protein